jgi:16S rRNA (cytosine967-C5)-methyltransferase
MARRAGVQDIGSQIVAETFFNTKNHNRRESMSWLDMCAGPGGKAALLYNLVETQLPEDSFLANEPTQHRAELVARVVPSTKVVSHDGRDVEAFGQKFDRILVDAPCTGLGALRRRPEARWRRTPADLKNLVSLQRELLDSAYQLLKPGGIIAYATCSPHLAETVGQVLDFTYRHKDMNVLPVQSFEHMPTGGENADGTLQLWTHLNASDSMFLALLEKQG